MPGCYIIISYVTSCARVLYHYIVCYIVIVFQGASEDAYICRSMQCFKPKLLACDVDFEQRAFTGTTCGNKTVGNELG